MKKEYISPLVEFVGMAVMPIMTAMSLPTDDGSDDGGRGNDSYQTGGSRNDWDNIWGDM